jgi:hypothetical protein
MSRTRRLTIAIGLAIGGAVALGGVAYAADVPEPHTPASVIPALDGHATPGLNSNKGTLSQLGHVKL